MAHGDLGESHAVAAGLREPGQRRGRGEIDLARAISLANQGDLDGAIRGARIAIDKDPKLEKAYLLLASACAMKTDHQCEAGAYTAGLAALPGSSSLLNERGLLRLRDNDLEGAVRDLGRAHELAGGLEPKLMADLAYAYIFVDRLDDAAALAKRASALDPQSVEAAMSEGEILLRQKRAKEAAEAFAAAGKLSADVEVNARLRRRQATALAMAGEHEAALAICIGLLPTDASDPMLRVQISAALMQLGRANEAVPHMRAAVKTEPRNVRFLSLLLQTQKHAGDKTGEEETRKLLAMLGVGDDDAKAPHRDPRTGEN